MKKRKREKKEKKETTEKKEGRINERYCSNRRQAHHTTPHHTAQSPHGMLDLGIGTVLIK